MFLEFLIAALLGILAGIFTGLTPGIHINLVSLLVVSSSAYLLGIFSLPSLGVFIISMAIAHTFLDILPAIFLGAPNEATALGVLPGHKLLLQGMGYEAVKLTVIGSLSSLILAILLFPLLIIIFPLIYDDIRPYIGFILIAVVIYMVLIEKGLDKKFWAFVVFLISGILGILALTMPNLKQPLFPLLSGLFGLSMLIVSLSQKVEIPKQRITENIILPKFQSIKSVLAGTFSGTIVSFFPGMGPAQAAVIGSNIFGAFSGQSFRKINRKSQLFIFMHFCYFIGNIIGFLFLFLARIVNLNCFNGYWNNTEYCRCKTLSFYGLPDASRNTFLYPIRIFPRPAKALLSR